MITTISMTATTRMRALVPACSETVPVAHAATGILWSPAVTNPVTAHARPSLAAAVQRSSELTVAAVLGAVPALDAAAGNEFGRVHGRPPRSDPR